MKKNLQRGFTLIELLVVVAIIGILSAIVLVSLNSARDKARDASAKGSLSSIRAAAEIFYDTEGGTYAGVCADSDVASLLSAASSETGGTSAAPTTVCASDASEYAATVTLNTETSGGDPKYFCVDSSGFAGDFIENTNSSGVTSLVPVGSQAATDYECQPGS